MKGAAMSNIRYHITLTFHAYDEDNNVCFTEEHEFGFDDAHYTKATTKYNEVRKTMFTRMCTEDVYTFASVQLVDRETWETLESSSAYL